MLEVYLNVFLYVKTIWLQTVVVNDIRFNPRNDKSKGVRYARIFQ